MSQPLPSLLSRLNTYRTSLTQHHTALKQHLQNIKAQIHTFKTLEEESNITAYIATKIHTMLETTPRYERETRNEMIERDAEKFKDENMVHGWKGTRVAKAAQRIAEGYGYK